MIGHFISFEGGEGVGKSTQITCLAGTLRRQGFEVVVTREPGGTAEAEIWRERLLAGDFKHYGADFEAMVVYLARFYHLRDLILPALSQGKWVLTDRFSDSTSAYQGAAGKADPTLLEALDQGIVGNHKPHLTFLLDLPYEQAVHRRRQRALNECQPEDDRFEKEASDFHNKVRMAFLERARQDRKRFRIINASTPADEQAQLISSLALALCGKP